MPPIRIAIAGIGNCASSLVQGVYHYRAARGTAAESVGLMHPVLGGYRVDDIEVVAAFDIDARKVGQPLEKALFALPNNTKVFYPDIPPTGVTVLMGEVHDGVAEHMAKYPAHQRFEVATGAKPVDVAKVLRETGADLLVSYMPVGSQKATEYYAQAALDAGVGFVNCVPCFVVSDPKWAARFAAKGLPCVGDDIKAQVGATITHRTLAKLFGDRGVAIDCTYQMNTGGNTDFLNMLNRDRLSSKKISKTEAVQSQLDVPLPADQIHIGPSDFVPFLKDNKVCFIRVEGTGFGGVPLNLELRLSVEDSPNSAAVVVDAIRACKLAKDAGVAGPLEVASAWCMKHPPRQMPDRDAKLGLEEFVSEMQAKARAGAKVGTRS
ncbi:MAG TPA: inositol-3-phosphate synthase [Humisphaera sp.]